MATSKSMFRNDLHGVDAYTRHKKLIRDYVLYYGGKPPSTPNIPSSYKTEYDIIREHHRFVRSPAEDDKEATWEQRVAKKYYDKLFKEYALCELKYYKEGRIALRWRTESEVISGKGQFVCASTRCDSTKSLKSWEVNFGYVEEGQKKNELVKVRLCPDCSAKLNYKARKRAAKAHKKQERKRRKRSRRSSSSSRDYEEEDRRSQSSEAEEEEAEEEKDKEAEASSIWSRPIESKEEKTKEEEFEDYFADLLQ